MEQEGSRVNVQRASPSPNETLGVGGWAVRFSDSSAKGFVGFPPKSGLFLNPESTQQLDGAYSLPSVGPPGLRSLQQYGLAGKLSMASQMRLPVLLKSSVGG